MQEIKSSRRLSLHVAEARRFRDLPSSVTETFPRGQDSLCRSMTGNGSVPSPKHVPSTTSKDATRRTQILIDAIKWYLELRQASSLVNGAFAR